MSGLAVRTRPLDESSLVVERGRSRRARWVLVAVALVCAVGWGSLRSEPGSGDTGRVPTPSPAAVEPEAVQDDVRWSAVAGMPLPSSRVDGPRCVTGTTAACFARTQRGAAFAAAHLVVRTFPFVGPRIFEPTIRTQVLGDHRSTLLRLTSQAYTEVAAAAGVQDGASLPVPSSDAVAGYRVLAPVGPTSRPLDRAEIGLLVRQTEDGGAPSFTEFVVVLRWVDGDWRLEAPAWGDWRSAARAIAAPENDFRPFDTDGGLR